MWPPGAAAWQHRLHLSASAQPPPGARHSGHRHRLGEAGRGWGGAPLLLTPGMRRALSQKMISSAHLLTQAVTVPVLTSEDCSNQPGATPPSADQVRQFQAWILVRSFQEDSTNLFPSPMSIFTSDELRSVPAQAMQSRAPALVTAVDHWWLGEGNSLFRFIKKISNVLFSPYSFFKIYPNQVSWHYCFRGWNFSIIIFLFRNLFSCLCTFLI